MFFFEDRTVTWSASQIHQSWMGKLLNLKNCPMKWEFFMGNTNKIWVNGKVRNSYTNVDMNFLDGTKEDTTPKTNVEDRWHIGSYGTVPYNIERTCSPIGWFQEISLHMYPEYMVCKLLANSNYPCLSLLYTRFLTTIATIDYSWWQLPPRNPRKIFPPFSNSFWDPRATLSCQKTSWLKKKQPTFPTFQWYLQVLGCPAGTQPNEVSKYGEPIPSSEWNHFARWK